MRKTNNRPNNSQAYILPIPNGWGVVVYGDKYIEDDEIAPLPYGDAMPYGTAYRSFATTPLGRTVGYIDGWETKEDLKRWEPDLYRRVWK